MSTSSLWLRRGFFAASKEFGWDRFTRLFLLVFMGGLAAIYLFVVLIDPYDRGRLPSFGLSGIADGDPRTATVSRGRNLRFDAAIIGNSRGQLLDPARLSQTTGFQFVQLTIPGSGPQEQLAIMRWFVNQRPAVAALVLVADDFWCTQDPTLPIRHPFPFWLYGDSELEYLSHLLASHAVDRAWRRLTVAAGLRRAEAADGYYNYEDGRVWNFRPAIPDRIAPVDPPEPDPPLAFPAIERLEALLARPGFAGRISIVLPPVFFTDLPRPGSQGAHVLNRCKAALNALAARRPRTTVLDFVVDTPDMRDPQNFMDSTHYRAALARKIESRISAALAP